MKLANFLRFIFHAFFFALVVMLLWSSFLVEENLQNLRDENSNIKSEILNLQEEVRDIKDSIENGQFIESKEFSIKKRPYIDPNLPNLLKEDQFYEKTLPALLGMNFKPGGTRFIATIGKPDDLHPFTNWGQVSAWQALCSASLARLEFGKYETFSPSMAIKIEERKRKDSNLSEYWVHLRDDLYWQPLSEKLFEGNVKLAPQFLKKQKVTSHDFKFYHDALMNPYNQEGGAVALRNYYGDIEEIEIIDDQTFVVRWLAKEVIDKDGNKENKIKYVAKQLTGNLSPLASFVYKYFPDGSKIIDDDSDPDIYRKSSVWAQNFAEHWAKNIIVSSGPWVFDGMTDRQIQFRRNPDHFNNLDALTKRIEEQFKNTPDTIWQDFKAGRLDTYNLQPDQHIEFENFLASDLYKEQVKQGSAIKRLDYPGRLFAYVGWNQENPFFKSRKVRRALTYAIDRDRIIEQYLNGMGLQITGPFAHDSSSYDKTIDPWPFNPKKALQLLEEEGWYDSDGDGIIDKDFDGKRLPFEFSLTYYVKNPTTKALCEYIADALSNIGIKCHLKGVDIADLSQAIEGRSFDALFLAWGLGTPPEDPRQLWHSEGANQPGSSNYISFMNKEVDEIIEKLTFEDDPIIRKQLYHRFHKILHDEQPYTFLYAPKIVMLYREYLQNVFIPANRQDLIPGADIEEPISSIFWIKN